MRNDRTARATPKHSTTSRSVVCCAPADAIAKINACAPFWGRDGKQCRVKPMMAESSLQLLHCTHPRVTQSLTRYELMLLLRLLLHFTHPRITHALTQMLNERLGTAMPTTW